MAKFRLKNSGPNSRSAGTLLFAFIFILALLILPVRAIQWLGGDLRWVAVGAVVLNILTYAMYAHDKNRAQEKGAWRVPEFNLHFLELLGGWPAAFLAQRRLRHKCSKGSYQFIFWLIVLLWQAVAFDASQDWKYSQMAINGIKHSSNHR